LARVTADVVLVRPDLADVVDLGALEALAGDERGLSSLAEQTRDERMSLPHWTTLLRAELLMLLAWAARRRVQRARASMDAGEDVRSGEAPLVLLPRYGFAVHALRRAVPFAALGLRVTCVVAEPCQQRAAAPIHNVARALGLGGLLLLSPASPRELVRRWVAAGEPIFLTGRRETYRLLRTQFPTARLSGATGDGSVVVARTSARARYAAARVSAGQLPESCTRLAATIVADGFTSDAAVESVDGVDGRPRLRDGSLGACVRHTHPSVVLVVDDDVEAVTSLAGYTALRCDDAGHPLTTYRFARDPVAGWPGDYCL
jgi:hypothetical protein